MSTSLVPFTRRFGLMSNEFEREFENLLSRFWGNGNAAEMAGWNPKLNIAETENTYEVALELPGMDPEHVDIELKRGVLTVTGERKSDTDEQDRTYHRVESHYGQFRRMFRFDEDVDSEHVDAQYKEGVLRITVPKAESAQTKRIEIKC